MNKHPHVQSVMTAFPYSIEINAPVSAALKMMREHDFHHLPVTDNKKLVSVVSERDLRFISGPNLDPQAGETWLVRDVCAEDPYIVETTEPLDNVLVHMTNQRIGSALVVKNGKLVGIFTALDGCRKLAEILREHLPTSGDEAA